MHHKYAAFIRFLNVCYDVLILNLVLVVMVGSSLNRPLGFHLISENKFIILWFNLLWMVASIIGRLYLYRNLVYFKEGVRRSAVSFLFFIFLEISLDFLFFENTLTPRGLLIQFLIGFGLLFWLARLLFYALKKKYMHWNYFQGDAYFWLGKLTMFKKCANW